MIKYIIFSLVILNALSNNLLSCPCEFSPDDERPFFEQYEIEKEKS